MKMENLDFKEALTLLAERAGVTLTRGRKQERARKKRSGANASSHSTRPRHSSTRICFASPSAGQPGRAYLAKRGISKAIAEEFQLGYAPERMGDADALSPGHGHNLEDALEIGLLSQRDGGKGPL